MENLCSLCFKEEEYQGRMDLHGVSKASLAADIRRRDVSPGAVQEGFKGPALILGSEPRMHTFTIASWVRFLGLQSFFSYAVKSLRGKIAVR